MENTAIFKTYLELGNHISARGAASFNCETLASPIICLYKSSELNIESCTMETYQVTEGSLLNEKKDQHTCRSTWRWQLSCFIHILGTL